MADPTPVDAAVTLTAPPAGLPPSKLGSMDALVRTMLLEAADGEERERRRGGGADSAALACRED